ncbi:MAG: DUF342 domain-containing protein, partial [Proteobacteria bacterium]|nr:DUF342 domain-containing protein [Pseudomonadota bacterium]
MKILIIDNDTIVRGNIADFLHKKGYHIFQSSNVARALGIVQLHPISIIICTKKNQDIDCIALCRNIRNQKKERYIYFIAITKRDEKAEKIEGLKQGIDAYTTYPVDFDKLEALVQVGMRITGFNSPQDKHNASKQVKTILQLPDSPKKSENSFSIIQLNPEAGEVTGLKKEEISKYDILLARIALETNLVTKEQLAKAFSFQKRQSNSGRKISLGDVFLEKEMISLNKIDNLYTATKNRLDRKFGVFVLKKGLATQEQVNKALEEQAREFKTTQSCRLTGDILVDHGVITKKECDNIRLEMKGLISDISKKTGPPGRKLSTKEQIQQNAPEESMFQIAVSEDMLEAQIQVNKHFSGKITPDDILRFLSRHHVQFGIVRIEEIVGFLNSDFRKNKSFTVAKGKPSSPGCDASIVYHFDTDHLNAGVINEEGKIDYKERGEIPRVTSGDLLATKKPMKKGKPGIDVFSNSIPVTETSDINLKCGEGTRLSEDALKVYATIDGQPVLALTGTISVYAELIIKGNVDFNTGNIDFDGNVHVNGAIMNGFVVKCGNLSAKEIVSGKILAIGDVTIQGGIINADIKAEGDVKAKFITDSNIKSFGNVIVDKEVINSKIRSSGKFIAERGKIISSFISAKMGFESKEIGTDVSHPCRINVGLDENVKKRIQAFDHILNDKKKTLESLQKIYEKQMKGLETINHQLSEQKILDKKFDQDLAAIETIIKEIETINEEKRAIIKWSK